MLTSKIILFAISIVLISSLSVSAFAATPVTVGPKNATAAANIDTGTDPNWTLTGNVFASDNARATTSLSNTLPTSELLIVNGFGFSIPVDVTIKGIQVSVEKSSSSSSIDLTVKLTKDGSTLVGTNLANGTNWPIPNQEAIFTYGNSTFTWGTTWNSTEINSSNFGLAIAAARDNGNPNPNIDYVTIAVTYADEAAPTPGSNVTPIDEATVDEATLTWNAGADNVVLATNPYVVFVANDTGFTNIVATSEPQSALSYNATDFLVLNTQYFWKVAVSDEQGNTANSTATSFIYNTAPFITAAATGSSIVLTYNENVDVTTTDGSGFTLSSGTVTGNDDLNGTSNQITLSVTGVNTGDTPDVIYTQVNGTVVDTASNPANDQIFAGTTDGVAPLISSVDLTNPTTITVTYSEPAKTAGSSTIDNWGLSGTAGTPAITAVQDISGGSGTQAITISGYVGGTLELTYTTAGTEDVTDIAGNALADTGAVGVVDTTVKPTYITDLLAFYNSRADLQAAFPEAANNDLKNVTAWAAAATTDGADVIGKHKAIHRLLHVWTVRPDLQAAFPEAANGYNSTNLINWSAGSGLAEYPGFLEPHASVYKAMHIWNVRGDISEAFPEAVQFTSLTNLLSWGFGAGITEYQEFLGPQTHDYALAYVWGIRPDLQAAYPEAEHNGLLDGLNQWSFDFGPTEFPGIF